MKTILLFSEDQDDDDLDALTKINQARKNAGMVGNLDPNQGQGNTYASKRRRGNHSRPIQQANQRKTRLSWSYTRACFYMS